MGVSAARVGEMVARIWRGDVRKADADESAFYPEDDRVLFERVVA